MNGRLLNMFQLQCRLRQPVLPQLSGCDMLRPYASAPAAACLSLILMIAGPAWAVAAAEDSAAQGEFQIDSTQGEFERLMAVARKTQRGAGSTVGRIDIADRPTLGAEDAQLVIVEIASFECP